MKLAQDAFLDAHAVYPVDTSRAKDGVWLVKVPNYLADLWHKAGSDAIVGQVVIATAASTTTATTDAARSQQRSQVSLVTESSLLANAGETGSLIPKEHQFLIQSTAPTASSSSGQELIILCEDDLAYTGGSSEASSSSSAAAAAATPASSSSHNTEAFASHSKARYHRRLSVFGRVNSRADCRPPSNSRYMKLKATQLKNSNRPKNSLRMLSQPIQAYRPTANHASNIENDIRKKAEGKNLRRDRDAVMQDLFKAYEKHQYYLLKDLVAITSQPTAFLAEILREIATYHQRAPHKNMWELKAEYRHYSARDNAAST